MSYVKGKPSAGKEFLSLDVREKKTVNIDILTTSSNALREKCPNSEFFWSIFSRIETEYLDILRISPYSVRIREHTDQTNSEYKHFLRIMQPIRITIGLAARMGKWNQFRQFK